MRDDLRFFSRVMVRLGVLLAFAILVALFRLVAAPMQTPELLRRLFIGAILWDASLFLLGWIFALIAAFMR